MNVYKLFISVALAAISMGLQASTIDQVRELWNPQGLRGSEIDTFIKPEEPQKHSNKSWYRLSNGQSVNIADWKVVLFMQGHCPYCQTFDPVLKSLSEKLGFGVMAYTIDGQGDSAYPEALPVPADVMKTFFPNLPVATPTTFLVNINTLEALPLLQGATDEQGFIARVDTVLQIRKQGK